MATENTSTSVVLENVRLSFPHLFEKGTFEGDDEEDGKYSACFIIDKSDKVLLKKIRAAIQQVKDTNGPKKWDGTIPKKLKEPLRDGDDERDGDEYVGMFFINASSGKRPALVDQRGNKILDRDKLYAGCYVHADINFYPFNFKGSKGIAAGLNSVMFAGDGEALAGGRSAQEAFKHLIEGPEDDDEDDKPKNKKRSSKKDDDDDWF